jgi:flavin-binding protein dodecin
METSQLRRTDKTVEITGSSRAGVEDAINGAIARAAKTLHNLRWFQDPGEMLGAGPMTMHWQSVALNTTAAAPFVTGSSRTAAGSAVNAFPRESEERNRMLCFAGSEFFLLMRSRAWPKLEIVEDVRSIERRRSPTSARDQLDEVPGVHQPEWPGHTLRWRRRRPSYWDPGTSASGSK